MKDKNKRILVLTPRLPFPVIGGDKLRIYQICKYLKEQGFRITLLSFVQNEKEKEEAFLNKAGKIFDTIKVVKLTRFQSFLNVLVGMVSSKLPMQIHYYKSKRFSKLLFRELQNDYQGMLFHLIRMAPYMMEYNINGILEMTDAISLNYERNTKVKNSNIRSLIYNLERKKVLEYEKKCIKRSSRCVVVSEVDRDYLLTKVPEEYSSKIKVFGNGVEESFFNLDRTKTKKNEIIFIGNLRSYQNKDAILFFIKEIWPDIALNNKDVRLKVIGSSPSKELMAYNGKQRIRITGEVEDIASEVKQAVASVAPIRIGAGVQNKILESMAFGIPVVCSTIASEGIDNLVEGQNILIADSPGEFTRKLNELIKSETLQDKLAIESREVARNYYTWSKKLMNFEKVFE